MYSDWQFNSSPGRTEKYCEERVSMPVCPLEHVQTSRNFLHMLSVAITQSSSDDNPIRYVFPVLWMTPMFAHNRPGKGDANMAYTQTYSPGAAPQAKSDDSDCLVKLRYSTSRAPLYYTSLTCKGPQHKIQAMSLVSETVTAHQHTAGHSMPRKCWRLANSENQKHMGKICSKLQMFQMFKIAVHKVGRNHQVGK